MTTDEIGISQITGTAINNTGGDLGYAQVTIRLLDDAGTQVEALPEFAGW